MWNHPFLFKISSAWSMAGWYIPFPLSTGMIPPLPKNQEYSEFVKQISIFYHIKLPLAPNPIRSISSFRRMFKGSIPGLNKVNYQQK
jgi:hypothetical protein